ncbi:SurA N-terminal domain-containing protein [Beijerinckia sp. L45]|uniref:SurA N-terminal domain-containing protein n=1 Tax=Beijerinckia sp. L45 TaxID=1641855 RepID=UPI00131E14AF|nr:SurA N-terminal domain-containing protein [Beijerinckia sp. L45]
MMNRMRAASQSWMGRAVMAIVLGFIIISFGFWGIGDIFTGFNANELAKIGSVRISVDTFRNAYQAELQRMEQKAKRGITNDEARRMGLDRQVLARLLTEAVLDQQSQKMGLAIGDADIAKSIFRDDSFKGANGQFDKFRFAALMRDNGLTEAGYVKEQRNVLLRQDVSDAVIGGVEVPQALSEAINRYQLETRAIDFFELPPAAAGEIPKPSDAELQKYYQDRKDFYQANEFRKLVTLAVIPASLVKPDAVTDADVQKRYDETKAIRFIVPEKRALQQIVFPDEAAATAAKAKLDGGETFEALIAERKLSDKDVDLGTVTKGQLAEKSVSDAAFALPEGGVSAPVKTQFGSVLVHVGKILPQTQQPLMEVSAQLKDEIAIIRAKAEATKLRDKIEEQRSAGKTLTEAAATVGTQTRVIDAVDAQGHDKADKPVEGIVDGPTLLKAAFASDVGADTDMISTANGGYAWYEVASIEPSRLLPLADVRAKVEAGWRKDETAKRLAAKSEELVKAINGGKAFAAVAAEQGNLKIQHSADVRRGGSPSVPSNVVAAVFGIGLHKTGSSADPAGGRILFQVLDAVVPPMDANNPEFKKIIEQVKGGYLDDALAQYLARLEQNFGIKINAQALAAAIGGDAGGGGNGS